MAIRLGYEKRGADLEAFVENTGNHSAAPGRPDQPLRTATVGRVAERSATALGPDGS